MSIAFSLYNLVTKLALPFLKQNKRLQVGLPQRLGHDLPVGPFDLWIQAASAGEAYLAYEILQQLDLTKYKVIVTTNTAQGMAILANSGATGWYFPFDRPQIMAKFIDIVRPKMVLVLETELWPAMLTTLKARQVPVVIANGRISAKSLKGYSHFKKTFAALAPNVVMAISQDDADRFRQLFPAAKVSVIPNIKFDRVKLEPLQNELALPQHLPKAAKFAVLGSVRKEEEAAVLQIVQNLLNESLVIGLYPRHMERVPAWETILTDNGIPYALQSQLSGVMDAGQVLLGDIFGELAKAYQAADAVFVGGTLAKLGGQNFLEPLACGVVPVIGESVYNFAWAGSQLFNAGLVIKQKDATTVAKALQTYLAQNNDKTTVQQKFGAYIANHTGGTAIVVAKIKEYLGAN